ncbi:MAG: hypothetical protein Kow0092_26780 [Deferrisomatales bacterium]
MDRPKVWPRRAVWLDDARREDRWCDHRTVLANFRGTECLGKTRDVSLGGMGLCLKGVCPPQGERVRVDVVFDRAVQEFRGRVVYVLPRRWGSVVGLRCEGIDPEVRSFLTHRYSSPSRDWGRLT